MPDVRRLYFLLILLAYTPAMFRSDPFGSLVVVIIRGGLAGFTWDLNRLPLKQLFEDKQED